MQSFYGGRKGDSLIIVMTFPAIESMERHAAAGAET